MDSVVCKHCEEEFVPQIGKPGYLNECPGCLIRMSVASSAKTRSESVLSPLEGQFASPGDTVERIKAKTERWRSKTRKQWLKAGMRADSIDEILELVENSPPRGRM